MKEKSVKTSRVAVMSGIAAMVFLFVGKVLNSFVFESLAYSALFGFLAAGEIGFFLTSREIWLDAHRQTGKLFFGFFGKAFACIRKYLSKNKERISHLFLVYFSILGSFSLVYKMNTVYCELYPLINQDRDLTLIFAEGLTMVMLLVLGAVGVIAFGMFHEELKRKELEFFYYIFCVYALIGVLSPILVAVFYVVFKLVFLLAIFLWAVCKGLGIICLQFLGVYVLLSVLRLATLSQIASVLIGAAIGAFCGYLMPGWSQWVPFQVAGAMTVAGFTGAMAGAIAFKVGQLSVVVLFHRLMLANKIKV